MFHFALVVAAFGLVAAQNNATSDRLVAVQDSMTERYLSMTVGQKNQSVALFGGRIWDLIKCHVCEKAIDTFQSHVVSKGCVLIDGIAISACELAGIGPEDPLSDVCAAAFVAGCKIVVDDALKHIHLPSTVCTHIHMC